MNAAVELSKAIYPEDCFNQATEAFKELGHLLISENSQVSYRVRFHASSGIDPTMFRHEFLNYLLNLSVERHLEAIVERSNGPV